MTATLKPVQYVSTPDLKRDLEDLTVEVGIHNSAILLHIGDLDEHERIVLLGRKRIKEIKAELDRRKNRTKK